jgi:hypothetical protein
MQTSQFPILTYSNTFCTFSVTSDDVESSDIKPAEGMTRQALPDAALAWSSSGPDMFDDLDWEIEAVVQDDSKAMTEEYLRKRKTVMEEKVCLSSYLFIHFIFTDHAVITSTQQCYAVYQ